MAHISNYTRKHFIESQIPLYVRQEYPIFVKFLEEYYNYLDRSIGQLIAIRVTNKGKNYSNATTVSLQILDENGDYVADTKGAAVEPYIINGQVNKIIVTNYGSDYTDLDEVKVVISDTTGTDAEAEAIIVNNAGNINQATIETRYTRDIDNETEIFTQFLYKEFLPSFPKNVYSSDSASVELTKILKFIKQFYTSTGIEDSISFLYRLLFNNEISFYYPKNDVLRVSDGRWQIDNFVGITGASGIDLTDYENSRILLENGTVAIVESVVTQGSTGFYISSINGELGATGATGIPVYNYPLTGTEEQIGTITSFSKSNGTYIGNKGQLSTNKYLQDGTYYQDYSYVIVQEGEESIKKFKGLLEELVHPAGLKYFIRLNLEANAATTFDSNDSIFDLKVGADVYSESKIYGEVNSLGPNVSSIDRNKKIVPAQPYIDFSSSYSDGPIGTFNFIDISDSSYFTTVPINSSVIVDTDSGTYYRTITDFNSNNGIATLDGTYTTANGSVSFRIIDNPRIAAINTSTKEITLDSKDTNYYIPYSPVSVSTLYVGCTGASGIFLNSSNDYNIILNDVIKIDNEQMLVNWVGGATAPLVHALSVTRGYNSTTISNHSVGATAYNLTDHRFRNWGIYITSGDAAGQYSKVTSYGVGATGVIKYSSSYTLHASGATAPTTKSTYWLVPDFGGSTGVDENFQYYSTGATGLKSITVANGGSGYSPNSPYGTQVVIEAPPYGTQAGATAVISGGVVTSIVVTEPGTGYYFTPSVTINQLGATGYLKQALAYATIVNTNSPSFIGSTGATGLISSSYTEYAGTILSLNEQSYNQTFIPATVTATISNGFVTSFVIGASGLGYVGSPRVYAIGGGNYDGSTGIFNAWGIASLTNGSVSSIAIGSSGLNYTYVPTVKVEEPTIKLGEKIQQLSTGAIGTIEYFDKDNKKLYVIRDYFSPLFDMGSTGLVSMVYGSTGFNINIDVVSVNNYNTLGKPINSISESEISVY